MNQLELYLARRHRLRNSLDKVNDLIDQEMAKVQLKCRHCKRSFPVGELTHIQTHDYIPPRGCTEGDYWIEGEGEWQCPKCKHRRTNRSYFDARIQELKPYFKARIEEHERS